MFHDNPLIVLGDIGTGAQPNWWNASSRVHASALFVLAIAVFGVLMI